MRRSVLALVLVLCAADAGAQQPQARASVPALDYYQILQLYARFNHAIDSGADNGNALAALFTPDGQYVDADGTVIQGREKLAALARGPAKGPTNVQHFAINTVVEPAAGGAKGRVYIVLATPDRPGQPRKIEDGGQYDDILVKTVEGWRIQRRTFMRSGIRP